MVLAAGRLLNGVRLAALAAEESEVAGDITARRKAAVAVNAASLGLCGGRDKQDVEHSTDAWSEGMAKVGWTEGFGGVRNSLNGRDISREHSKY